MGIVKKKYREYRENGYRPLDALWNAIDDDSDARFYEGGIKNGFVTFGESFASSYVFLGSQFEKLAHKLKDKINGSSKEITDDEFENFEVN